MDTVQHFLYPVDGGFTDDLIRGNLRRYDAACLVNILVRRAEHQPGESILMPVMEQVLYSSAVQRSRSASTWHEPEGSYRFGPRLLMVHLRSSLVFHYISESCRRSISAPQPHQKRPVNL